MKTSKFFVKIPTELKEEFEKAEKQYGFNKNEIIEIAMRTLLDQIKKQYETKEYPH